MELEEMKSLWGEMDSRLKNQELLNEKLIREMTKDKYESKMGSIFISEIVGTFICYIMVMLTLINFYKLDTWYLIASGLYMIFCLGSSPISVYYSYKLKNVDLVNNDIRTTLYEFYKWKNKFTFTYKLYFLFSFFLIFICPPAINKMMFDINIIWSNQKFYTMLFFAGVIGFLFLGIILHFTYNKSIISAEELIKDLEND